MVETRDKQPSMKQTFLWLVISVLFSGSLAQANSVEGIFGTRLTRKAERLAHKLQMSPFVLGTDKKDECAVDQLHVFMKSWRHSSGEVQESAIYAAKAINSLSIDRSIQSGTLTGTRTILSFVVCSQGRQDRCGTISKVIGEKFVLNGSSPKTTFSKSAAKNIVVTTELLKDNHVSIRYTAETRNAYDRTNSVDSPDFSKALSNAEISRSDEIPHDDTVCGSVPLEDLIFAFSH